MLVRKRARAPGLGNPLPWLAGLIVVYLAFPVVAFAVRTAHTPNRGFGASGLWPALGVSVVASTIALSLTCLLGVPLAFLLATRRGWLSNVVTVIVQLPLALPPLMSGILLLFVVGPYTPAGRFFDGRLTESLTGVVLAQTFVSAPFLIIAARSAFEIVDPATRAAAASLGHGPLARFFRVDLPGAAGGIRAGMVLAWLRAFGEYGATLIVAYHPFSLPIFTENQFETFPLSTTEAPTILAVGVAAAVVLIAKLHRPAPREMALPPGRGPRPGPPTTVGFDLAVSVGTFHLQVSHQPRSSRLAVIGPSGSGKSVTLQALCGLLGPNVGSVTFSGVEVHDAPPEVRHIGFVPQGLGLIPGQTVWQQVLFGVRADPALAAWWVTNLGLQDLLLRYPQQLSGGQRQRVALARALATAPDLVVLDEPFSALDAPVRDEFRRELRRVQQHASMSTVIVTHDAHEAAFLASDVIVIDGGRVLQDGSVGEVFQRPASAQVARLVGLENVWGGIVTAAGRVRCGPITMTVNQELPVGQTVLWNVSARSIRIDAVDTSDGSPPALDEELNYPAVVGDIVDLGTEAEVTVVLSGSGPQLRARLADVSDLSPGDRCRVRLDPDDISAWQVARPATASRHDTAAPVSPVRDTGAAV